MKKGSNVWGSLYSKKLDNAMWVEDVVALSHRVHPGDVVKVKISGIQYENTGGSNDRVLIKSCTVLKTYPHYAVVEYMDGDKRRKKCAQWFDIAAANELLFRDVCLRKCV